MFCDLVDSFFFNFLNCLNVRNVFQILVFLSFLETFSKLMRVLFNIVEVTTIHKNGLKWAKTRSKSFVYPMGENNIGQKS